MPREAACSGPQPVAGALRPGRGAGGGGGAATAACQRPGLLFLGSDPALPWIRLMGAAKASGASPGSPLDQEGGGAARGAGGAARAWPWPGRPRSAARGLG
jgi:hypothetical protein